MEGDIEWPDDKGPESLRAPAAATPPAGDTPPASATPPADSGTPPVPGAAPDASAATPDARFDDLNARFTTLEGQHRNTAEENRRLRQALGLVMGRDPSATPSEPPDPRLPKIREALLKAFPELANVGDLLKTTSQRAAEEKAANDRFAARSIERTLNHCATQLLGAGKTAKDLSPRQAKWLRENYIDWVFDDEKRMERYNDNDPTLQSDFWNDYHSEMRASAARAPLADVEKRGARVDRLPNAGPSAAPVSSPAPTVDNSNADAVHRRAAERVFGQRQAS